MEGISIDVGVWHWLIGLVWRLFVEAARPRWAEKGGSVVDVLRRAVHVVGLVVVGRV